MVIAEQPLSLRATPEGVRLAARSKPTVLMEFREPLDGDVGRRIRVTNDQGREAGGYVQMGTVIASAGPRTPNVTCFGSELVGSRSSKPMVGEESGTGLSFSGW